jgi:predicted P-loop ATPase
VKQGFTVEVIEIGERARAAWQSRCQLSSTGRIIPNTANALEALRGDYALRDVFAYDEMVDMVVMTHEIGQPMEPCDRWVTDNDVTTLQVWLQQQGKMPSIALEAVRGAMVQRAHESSFHPLKDWLRELEWDGTQRLGVWLASYLGAELNAYNAHIGRLFLISMVARAVDPGCQCDHMMVLEGDQGIMKSSACKVLAGEWFSDNLPEIGSPARDISQHLRGKWLIEVAEMHAMGRAEATLLKSFITRTHERYLKRYARVESIEGRSCVFVGTTNAEEYLKDPTGGRRFWPVKVGVRAAINIELLAQYREQLFAEAVAAYRAGDPWWPDASFERELIKPEQAARYAGDIWEDRIEKYLGERLDLGHRRVTVAEIAREALGIVDSIQRTDHAVRIAQILKQTGWVTKRSGKTRWWEPP